MVKDLLENLGFIAKSEVDISVFTQNGIFVFRD